MKTPLDIVGEQMDVIKKGLKTTDSFVPMTFGSIEEAEEYFYKHFSCNSDDPDSEHDRVDRWIEDNEIIIEE